MKSKTFFPFVISAIVLMFMFSTMACVAQVGIYQTIEEYKRGTPSKTGDWINSEMVFGKWSFTLHNGKDKQKFDAKSIWGYKKGNRDYRIIDGEPYFIATKGALYIYSGIKDSIQIKGNEIIYHKIDNRYPYLSKGINGELVKIHNYKDILKQMEPKKAAEIEAIIQNEKKHPKQSITVTSFSEDIADYYNSLQPGYVGPRFTSFEYVYNRADYGFK